MFRKMVVACLPVLLLHDACAAVRGTAGIESRPLLERLLTMGPGLPIIVTSILFLATFVWLICAWLWQGKTGEELSLHLAANGFTLAALVVAKVLLD